MLGELYIRATLEAKDWAARRVKSISVYNSPRTAPTRFPTDNSAGVQEAMKLDRPFLLRRERRKDGNAECPRQIASDRVG